MANRTINAYKKGTTEEVGSGLEDGAYFISATDSAGTEKGTVTAGVIEFADTTVNVRKEDETVIDTAEVVAESPTVNFDVPNNDLTVNNLAYKTIGATEDFNIELVDDADGVTPITPVIDGDKLRVPNRTLKFRQRVPAEKTQYNSFDPAWRYANGHISDLLESEFYQEIGENFWQIKYDDSELTGITQHKYRFINTNGGYMIPTGVSAVTYYDIDGSVSSVQTVAANFTKDGDPFCIDRLTGLAIAFDSVNQINSASYADFNIAFIDLWETISYAGYTGEWFCLSMEEFDDFFKSGQFREGFVNFWRSALFFDLDNTQVIATPTTSSPTTRIYTFLLSNLITGTTIPVLAPPSGRFITPFRKFDFNDLILTP